MALESNKNIGNRLKKLRIRASYKTPESFAAKNKLSKISYANIEKGQTNIRMSTLLKLLDIHKVSLIDFFR
jgi:transcriptional regulator with XRE-family HTH domain